MGRNQLPSGVAETTPEITVRESQAAVRGRRAAPAGRAGCYVYSPPASSPGSVDSSPSGTTPGGSASTT